MKHIAKPMALILAISILSLLHPQPILAQSFIAQVTETKPTIHMSPEKEIAAAAEVQQASGSKKGWLWGLVGLVALVGGVAAMAGGGGGGDNGGSGGDNGSGEGGISFSW
jgi:hypothetical protein